MAKLLTSPLSSFIKAATQRPFSWGEHDCLTWLGEWVAVSHGDDPAARWRGTYDDERGAYRLLARFGGMGGIIEEGVAHLGIRRTDEPQAGDIAVVQGPNDPRAVGAIILGAKSASLGVTGVYVRDVPILSAWRI